VGVDLKEEKGLQGGGGFSKKKFQHNAILLLHTYILKTLSEHFSKRVTKIKWSAYAMNIFRDISDFSLLFSREKRAKFFFNENLLRRRVSSRVFLLLFFYEGQAFIFFKSFQCKTMCEYW